MNEIIQAIQKKAREERKGNPQISDKIGFKAKALLKIELPFR